LYALIFANGELEPPPDLDALLATADLLIAADGGAQHLAALGKHPDVLIGDLDSLSPGEAEALQAAGVQLILHPAAKDQTDLELALLHAAEAGAERIEVLGGLGRRWDHSLANLLLPALPQLAACAIRFLHGTQTLFLIRSRVELALAAGTRLSLLPVGGDAAGVRTRGLLYPLKGETLHFGSSRGVSNEVVEPLITIEIASGTLICVLDDKEQT
jgi:thiamine pyrophosphokinase